MKKLPGDKIIIGVLVVAGLVLTQLPMPNSYGVTVSLVGLLPFLVLLLASAAVFLPVSKISFLGKENREFLQVIVVLLSLSLIMKFTGGIFSYFKFLYLIPVLFAASRFSRRVSIATSVFAGFLVWLSVWGLQGSEVSSSWASFSVTIFGVVLMGILGRTLAGQLSLIHKHQEELQIEQLKELDQVKDEFVFIIAHELRGPITAIRGYLELINEEVSGKVSENLKALLEKAFTTSTLLADMVGLLLEIARVETGKIRFYYQKIDLRDSIDFVLESLKTDWQPKHIEIIDQVEKENMVSIDKERLEEILKVIIGNAVKFTPVGGKVLISSQRTEKHIIISVGDNGVGISPERKKQLFDKYYVEETAPGVQQAKSYGVSLYATKQLLLLMKGDITCDSVPGRGSTFNLYLPSFWGWENSSSVGEKLT